MQITPPTDPKNPQDTPLHQILLNTANMFWALSAPSAAKDHAPSATGELTSIALTMPFFARHKEAFVCPRMMCALGNISPREFVEQALSIPAERAQELADWILQDIADWSEGFNSGRRRGSLFKEQEIKKATLVLARIGEDGLGLVNDNGHPAVKAQKEFYSFMENTRYTEEIGAAMTGIELPARIKERFLPMIEASELRETIQAARAKSKAKAAEEGIANGFPGAEAAEEAFAAVRHAKRL